MTACCIKRKEVAAAFAGLIFAPTDRDAFEVAEKQGSDTAMGNNGDVAVGHRHRDDALNGIYDPALRVLATLPSSYAVFGSREELVGHSLEFAFRQIASRRTVVLAQALDDNGMQSE